MTIRPPKMARILMFLIGMIGFVGLIPLSLWVGITMYEEYLQLGIVIALILFSFGMVWGYLAVCVVKEYLTLDTKTGILCYYRPFLKVRSCPVSEIETMQLYRCGGVKFPYTIALKLQSRHFYANVTMGSPSQNPDEIFQEDDNTYENAVAFLESLRQFHEIEVIPFE